MPKVAVDRRGKSGKILSDMGYLEQRRIAKAQRSLELQKEVYQLLPTRGDRGRIGLDDFQVHERVLMSRQADGEPGINRRFVARALRDLFVKGRAGAEYPQEPGGLPQWYRRTNRT